MKFDCDCLERFKQGLEENYKKENSTEFKINGPFNQLLSFSTMETNHAVECEMSQREIKKNGEPYKNLTKDSCSLTLNYCPFCGKEMIEEK